MMNNVSTNIATRTYVIINKGKFEAAHYLEGYPGKCKNLHGHRWEVTATLEFPSIPMELVEGEYSDGIIVDFSDISELWEELDHPEETLNEKFQNPTCEVLSNYLLTSLIDYVTSLVSTTIPFYASIELWESEDNCCVCSAFVGPDEAVDL